MALGLPLPLMSEHPEIPNFLTIIEESKATHGIAQTPLFQLLCAYQNEVFSLLMVVLVSLFVIRASRRFSVERPTKVQNALESIVEGFDGMTSGFLGRETGRFFLPFLGTLFFFIWFNNMMGMVPFMKASTSWYATTLGLALCTFVVVQITAVIKLNPLGYLHHLMGEPRGGMWVLAPLFLVLHLIGEVAKPLSLSLRLFGNILGEDILLGTFLGFGVAISAAIHMDLLPIPLHLPFMFLSLLAGSIQAVVFFMLSMIYIQLVLPHHEEEGH
ncbi:F0F1 ATP synthase subunit A [Candidatus Sumerlaeota bacterium]|nr:F0F1 ATP synthase subunit A [Candidatus Sumerlaeota bacterium]